MIRPARQFPGELPDPSYPEHFEVRRLLKEGALVFHCQPIRFGRVLQHEVVGIEPVSDGKWQLWFGPIYLGLLSEEGKGKHIFMRNELKLDR
jgi:hypothetical protein